MFVCRLHVSNRPATNCVQLALEKLDVPIIAAVNGPAMGAGCDLTTMCDIRIAAESARFAESFVKLGLVAGDGGSWLLPRVVGLSKAYEMALTGDTIDAQQALACGLVSQVVPDAELMPAARKLALRIAANPTQAVRMTKRLIREGQQNRLDTLLEMAASFQALVHTTADHREAATSLTGSGRLDPGIQSQQIGLEGNFIDHADDLADFRRGFLDRPHGRNGLPDNLALARLLQHLAHRWQAVALIA
jgi:1,4-dihydroxy-2-naphthoyl-CoA synthase